MGARLTERAEGPRPKAEGQSVGTQGRVAKAAVQKLEARPQAGWARGLSSFVLKNFIVWLLMVVVLVLVPDTLEPWLGIEVARVVGWGVAFPVWMIVVERDWQARFGPVARVVLQVPLWIAAALLAIWISEQAGRKVF